MKINNHKSKFMKFRQYYKKNNNTNSTLSVIVSNPFILPVSRNPLFLTRALYVLHVALPLPPLVIMTHGMSEVYLL